MSTAITAGELTGFAVFGSLPAEVAGALLERQRPMRLPAGQMLVIENDDAGSVFLVRQGIAKVRSITVDGEEVLLSLLGRGELIGEMALIDHQPRSADVVSITDVELVRLPGPAFERQARRSPELAMAIASLMAGRLRDLNRRFLVHSGDATSRLLDSIAYLARTVDGDGDPLGVIPQRAQRELPLLAGLARETASRTLSRLRRQGVVEESPQGFRLTSLDPLRRRGLLESP
jgi:CRP-like cAMP-binding protein